MRGVFPSLGKCTGFTLLELILSLTIFGIIAGAVVGMLHIGITACARGREFSQGLQVTRMALDRMVTDLASTYYSDSVLCTDFLGEDATEGAYDADRLTLASTARFADAGKVGQADLSELEYFIGTDSDAGEVGLCCRHSGVMLAAVEEESDQVQKLGDEIVGLNLRYFDGLDWQDSWDASAKGKLPQAVEITLQVRESGAQQAEQETTQDVPTRGFRTAVALPTQARTAPDGSIGGASGDLPSG